MQPLYQAIAGKPKQLEWTGDTISAFERTKDALVKVTELVYPQPDAPLAVTVDASSIAVGAVLEQLVDNHWQPLAFFSKPLRPGEKKYSTFNCELLAVHLAVRHFRHFLEGRDFTVFTDHKPLTFAFAKVSDPWSARQQRHLAAISEYTTCVRHVAGKDNLVADALSHTIIHSVHCFDQGIYFKAMAEDQSNDPDMDTYKSSDSGLTLAAIPFGLTKATLLCDVSTGQLRPNLQVFARLCSMLFVVYLTHLFELLRN